MLLSFMIIEIMMVNGMIAYSIPIHINYPLDGLITDTVIKVNSTKPFNITQRLEVTVYENNEIIEHQVTHCKYISPRTLSTEFFDINKVNDVFDVIPLEDFEKQFPTPSSLMTSTIVPETVDNTSEPITNTLNYNTGTDIYLQTMHHVSDDESPNSKLRKRLDQLSKNIIPTFDPMSSVGFGQDAEFYHMNLEDKYVRHRRSNHNNIKPNSTEIKLILIKQSEDLVSDFRQAWKRIAFIHGHLIASLVTTPSPHCFKQFQLMNPLKCLTTHHRALEQKPDYRLIIGLYSEIISLYVKIEYELTRLKMLRELP
ncbi:PP3 [Ceratitis capitata sigmavirus]|uniref:Uncharacterized protein n=2 Tax=root TaxID=1 RepID=W8BHB3_CERCA|nr:PP3 [Ceratitis capitata sigmavirus]AMK09268.1 PP3 [Ceratitis capitata sigmavirus]